jgi:hypothetical protein
MKNATRILGISIHSLGEMDIIDYYAEYSNREVIIRPHWYLSSTFSCMIMSYIFALNTIISYKMVISQPRISLHGTALYPLLLV